MVGPDRWRRAALTVGFSFVGAAQAQAPADRTLMRFPTLYGNTIVFEANGNLWRADRAGGVAQRLTSDPGYNLMPRFSPDGKYLYFVSTRHENPTFSESEFNIATLNNDRHLRRDATRRRAFAVRAAQRTRGLMSRRRKAPNPNPGNRVSLRGSRSISAT